jgi:hypothetical protein
MEVRIQILLIVVTVGLLAFIIELVRRRHLQERYALLWLLAAIVLVVLAIFRNLLEVIAHAIGVFYAPSALFVIAFGFVLILLLHFSLTVSRLSDQNKVLAQYVGLLREHLKQQGIDLPPEPGEEPETDEPAKEPAVVSGTKPRG